MARPKGYVSKAIEDRFEEKIARLDSDGCWLWTGFIDKGGYARLRLGGRDLPVLYVHRYSYERFVGPVPDGLQIDHLCRVRHCVNPAHLEAVTNQENTRRGVFTKQPYRGTGKCGAGHDMATEGCYVKGRYVYCRACRRKRRRDARESLAISGS